jgi:topoisomerase-4 subunit A
VLYDADNQGYPYLKRFQMDASKKKQNWLSDNPSSQLLLLTDTPYPRLQVTYGGADAFRGSEEIDAEQFIAVKGYKAKGKRLTTYALESIEELEPTRFPEPTAETTDADNETEEEDLDPDAGKSEQQIRDELTGQLNLFDNEDFK